MIKTDIGLLMQYATDGLTRDEIAEKMGVKYSAVSSAACKYGITIKRKERKKEQQPRGPKGQTLQILELRKSGKTYNEIIEALGCCKDTVRKACTKHGLGSQKRVYEEDAIKVINALGFDYVKGFTNTKGTVTIKCRECGTQFVRYYDAIRNDLNGKRKEKITCPGCQQKEIDDYRQKKNEPKKRVAQMKAEQRAMQLSLKVNEKLTKRLATRVCMNCGKNFSIACTGYNSEKYCSSKCQNRWHDRIKNDRRLRRMINNKHDDDITLEKLYQRDDGVCYLCGNVCDWLDIEEKDGTVIAGGSYPSIDHVKPISKGGTHTWDNIRLACRACNTKKGWS